VLFANITRNIHQHVLSNAAFSILHQNLVWMVKFAIEIHLGVPPAILEGDEGLKATQMMTRTVETTAGGTMYYVKVHTAGVKEFPWCFCKIFEPETITTVSPVKLHGFKKMAQEYKLVTF
jgi:hypothetical protein